MTRIEFGPFVLDRATGELWKDGAKVRLQEQPMILLMALLERPGKVVSRETLCRRIWGDDIHVDFEDGLNAATRRLRQTLGDSADHPCYIETLPRKGYRFLTTARERPTEEVPALVPPDPPRERPSPTVPGRRRSDLWQVRPGLFTAGLLTLGLVGAVTWATRPAGAPSSAIHSLAVLPLHTTGEQAGVHLADGLTEELTAELAKAGNLRVVPAGTSARFRNSTLPLTHIARDLGVEALVEGSLVQDGNRYRLVVMLVRSGEWSQWAGTYESDPTGIHGLMTRVAADLEEQLR
ncbi:MAG TPA: winged helix-turn-helix domain-containing protein [Holophagaceae bacterium]|nr:winged helix-turn-helix domain-containing protein [Holophagaceae bacterium]